MLPKGYVSDQANEFFSPYEQQLMQDSFVSLYRQFLGPGKRGGLSQKDLEKSEKIIRIGLDCNKRWILNYIIKGIPHLIPHFWKLEKEMSFSFPRESNQKNIDEFIINLKNFNDRFNIIFEKELLENEILVGFNDGKYYVGTSNQNIDSKTIKDQINIAINNSIDKIKQNDMKMKEEKIEQKAKIIENSYISRIYAKIAINTLAYIKGEDIASNPCFKEIKEWILEGKNENKYFQYPDAENLNLNNLLGPGKYHSCIIVQIGKDICATVSFYNLITGNFRLGSSDNRIIPDPIGLICDWENGNDYNLYEFINMDNMTQNID